MAKNVIKIGNTYILNKEQDMYKTLSNEERNMADNIIQIDEDTSEITLLKIRKTKNLSLQLHPKNLGIKNEIFDSISVNTILHTRDGRKIGNAIVIGEENNFFNIKTDYGNTIKLTISEINELFYIAYQNLSKEENELMRTSIGEHKNKV